MSGTEGNILRHFLWESTRKCNLGCRHCGSGCGAAARGELSTAEAMAMLEDVSSLGALFFSITGGEPLTRKDIFGLISHADSLGMNSTLITNGCLVGRQTAERLAASGLRAASVSIDGMREYHDCNRGKSFEKALNALNLFRENGIITCASMMVCDSNLAEVKKVHKMCAENGFERLNIYMPQKIGRAKENNMGLGSQGAAGLIEFALENRGSGTKIVLDDGFGPFNDCFECSAGRSHLAVSAEGEIRPCASFPYPAGNVRKKKISDAWNSGAFDCFRKFDSGKIGAPCSGCEMLRWCGGGCRAKALQKYGNFYAGNTECKEISEKKPGLLSKVCRAAAVGAVGAGIALAGCVTPPEEAQGGIEIKKINFEVFGGAYGCGGAEYYPVMKVESGKQLDLREISLLADGYPLEAGLGSSSVAKDPATGKFLYDLNFSGKPAIHESLLFDKKTTISFDYHADDILSSTVGGEQLSMEAALPIREGYPINIYLRSNIGMAKGDAGYYTAEMNGAALQVLRLADLNGGLYLLTLSGKNIELGKENQLTVRSGQHLLSKKFSTATSGDFYIDQSYTSMCPMMVTAPPLAAAIGAPDAGTLLLKSPWLPPDLNAFTIMEKSGDGYRSIGNNVSWEKIEGYGYALSLEKELGGGEYGLNPKKWEQVDYWSALVEFKAGKGTKYIHLLESAPEK